MRLVLLFLFVVAAFGAANASVFKAADYSKFFTSFMTRFRRSYTAGASFTNRLNIFKANLDKITLANAKQNAGFKINALADRSHLEFKEMLGGKVSDAAYKRLHAGSLKEFQAASAAPSLLESDAGYFATERASAGDNDKKKKDKKKADSTPAPKPAPAPAAEEKLTTPLAHLRALKALQADTFYISFGEGAEKYAKARAARKEFIKEFASQPFDWRSKGVVGPVKDQKNCGSCWTFGTLGSIEPALAIHKMIAVPNLSEQHLLECNTVSSGCRGGTFMDSFKFVREKGMYDTASYGAYTAKQGACSIEGKTKYPHSIADYIDLSYDYKTDPADYEDDLMLALMYAPVAVTVKADPSLQFWAGKTVFPENCTDMSKVLRNSRGVPMVTVDHAVVVVGHTKDENGVPVWIVRNSWGPTWGRGDGTYYMARAPGQNSCGIHTSIFAPLME